MAMSEAITAYEAEFGEISAQEIAEQMRADRSSAVVLRGRREPDGSKRSGAA
jgi:hypothetical protein